MSHSQDDRAGSRPRRARRAPHVRPIVFRPTLEEWLLMMECQALRGL